MLLSVANHRHDGIYWSGTGIPAQDAERFQEGDRILNRFTIVALCDEGTYSTVYRAYDTVEQVVVGLKISKTGTDREPDIAASFIREVMIDRRLGDGTNVRRAFTAFPFSRPGLERMVLSVEYADKGSLRLWLEQVARGHNASWDELVELILATCRGLFSLHAIGVTNIDFKPENVVFVNGRAKLADYGMACVSPCVGHPEIPPLNLPLTERLTAEYRQSESAYGGPAATGAMNDIYAFGKVLMEIAAACPSFKNSERCDGHDRHIKSLQTIIGKAMSSKSEKQYANSETLLADIEDWAAHDDTILVQPPSTQREAGKNSCLEDTAADGSPDAVDATLLAINEIHESVVRSGAKSSIRFLRSKLTEVHELSSDHPVASAIKQRYENACKKCNRSLRRAEDAVLQMECAFALNELLSARQYLPEHSGLSECIGILHAIVRALERGLGDKRYRKRPDEVRRRWLAFHSSSRVDEACTYLGKRLHAMKVRP